MGRSYRQEYPWNLQVFCVLLSVALWVAPILLSSSLTDWFGVTMDLRHGEYVVQERSPYERSEGDPITVRHTLWQSSGEAILPLWTIAAVLTVVVNLIPLIVYRSRWRRFRLLGLCCSRCDGKLNLNNVARYDEAFLCDDCAKQMEDMERVALTRFAIIAPKIAPPPSS